LALRSYIPADTAAESRRRLSARGLTGTAPDAAAEACLLELAVRAERAGAPAAETAHVLPGGGTLKEEVRWLRQVGAAVRSGHVRTVAAELSQAPITHPAGGLRQGGPAGAETIREARYRRSRAEELEQPGALF
jgi:hypothetical protein